MKERDEFMALEEKAAAHRLRRGQNVGEQAAAAAIAVADAGGGPRAQIDAARRVSGTPIRYLAHQGAREIARRARRLAQGRAPA